LTQKGTSSFADSIKTIRLPIIISFWDILLFIIVYF